jgi:hypothetical protein
MSIQVTGGFSTFHTNQYKTSMGPRQQVIILSSKKFIIAGAAVALTGVLIIVLRSSRLAALVFAMRSRGA